MWWELGVSIRSIVSRMVEVWDCVRRRPTLTSLYGFNFIGFPLLCNIIG
jgi:hypothetical protein